MFKSKIQVPYFIGDINFIGDLIIGGSCDIDGTITGSVRADGKVTLGKTGIITGNLSCDSAVISGKVEGTIVIEDILKLNDSAVINGDIYSGGLECHNGAEIEGKINIGFKWKEILDGQEEDIRSEDKENILLSEKEQDYTQGRISGKEFFSNED